MGNSLGAFSFIDDYLQPLWKAATLPAASKIINLGGIEATTILEANKTLLEVIGAGEVVFKEPRHKVKVAHPTGKSQKIKNLCRNYRLRSQGRSDVGLGEGTANEGALQMDQLYTVTNGLCSFWR